MLRFKWLSRRLWPLLLTLLFTTSACGALEAKPAASAGYSGAFVFWFYRSIAVPAELKQLQSDPPASTAEQTAVLQELAQRQSLFNEEYRSAEPSAKWRAQHEVIRGELEAFNDATKDIRDNAAVGDLKSNMQRLSGAEARLLDHVVTCYANPKSCRGIAREAGS